MEQTGASLGTGTIITVFSGLPQTYMSLLRPLLGRPFSLVTIKAFFEEVKATRKPSTVCCTKSALKKWLKGQTNDIRVKAVIEEALKEFKVPVPDQKIYQEQVVNDNQKLMIQNQTTDRRSTLIEFLDVTGLRISEALSVKLEDLDIQGSMVYVYLVGKRGKERRIFFPFNLLQQIVSAYEGKIWLFENCHHTSAISRTYATRAVKIAGKAIGLNIHAHNFRHSFATRTLIEHKKDLKAVSLYLGHANVTTTCQMYIHSELTPNDLFRNVDQ